MIALTDALATLIAEQTTADVMNLLSDESHTADELANTLHVADGGDHDEPVAAALAALAAAGLVREKFDGRWVLLAAGKEKVPAAVKVGEDQESAPAEATNSTPTVPEQWGTHIAPAAEHQVVLQRFDLRARVLELGFIIRDDARHKLIGVYYGTSSLGTAKTAERAVRKRLREVLLDMQVQRTVDVIAWEPIEIERYSPTGVPTDVGAMPGIWVDDVEAGEICAVRGCENLGDFEPYTDGQTMVHFAPAAGPDSIMRYREGDWFISTHDDQEIRSEAQLEAYFDARRRELLPAMQRMESLNARLAAECDDCWGSPEPGTWCSGCGKFGAGAGVA